MSRIFKRLSVIFLGICLGALLVSCGGGNGGGNNGPKHDCAKDGHIFGEPEYTYTEARCTTPGEVRVRCSVCDETEMRETEPLGHNGVIIEEAIEPTCTTTGRTAKIKCDRQGCWEVIQQPETVEKKEHEAKLLEVNAPDYIHSGRIVIGCENCESFSGYVDLLSVNEGNYTFVRNEGENKIYSGTVEGYDVEFAVSNFVLEYRYMDGYGRYILTEYKGESTNIIIPQTVGEQEVDGIDDTAFKNNINIVSVTFPDSLDYVAAGAFSGCTSLERIENYSYGRYPERIFENCTSLRTLVIGENVFAINDYAFAGCTSLESVVFEESELYSRTIGEGAFKNCSKLEVLKLIGSVTLSGRGVFEGCTSVKELVADGLSGYDSAYIHYLGDLFTYQYVGNSTVNANIPASLKKVTISIGLSVMNAAGLESITLIGEDHKTTLQEEYFSGCASLTEIVLPNNIVCVGANLFEGCTSLQFDEKNNGVYFGTMLVGLTEEAKNGGITEFVVAEGTTIISPDFFEELNLDKLTVPSTVKGFRGVSSVTEMGAFYYAGTLEDWFTVSIDEEDHSPMKYAEEFYMLNTDGNYEPLGSTLVIPESIKEIFFYHIYGWEFTTIVIHGGVEGIYARLPETLNCIRYSGTMEQWLKIGYNGQATMPLNRTSNFYVPDGNGGWEMMKVIVIPEGMKRVYNSSFWGFANVETVVIPSTVEYIEQYAFSKCTSIANVFYEGNASDWQSLSSQNSFHNFGSDVNIYYYAEDVNTAFAGLNSGDMYWHYDKNGKPIAWSDGIVSGKTYNYTSTEVTVSNEYWMLLQYADAQGVLENLLDAEQLAMYRSSSNKEEFAAKVENFASKTGTNLKLTFANGKLTMSQNGQSTVIGNYLEMNGEIYVKIGYQVSVFCYIDAENNQVYEYNVVEDNGIVYTATKHVYDLMTE